MLEFCVPHGVWRPLWELYVRVGLPPRDAAISRGWHEVGRFLGPSIRGFYAQLAARAAARALASGGHRRRPSQAHEPRRRGRDLGRRGEPDREPGRVRPAFYALRAGGWRDYVTLLHPPYTAWHLSYVVVGGCLAAGVPWGRLGLTVLAFSLAHGRRRARARRALRASARDGASRARARRPRRRLGRSPPARSGSPWRVELQPLAAAAVAIGAFLVPAYNLELARRTLPLRPLVRARVGRVPRRHRLRRLRRARAGRSGARRRLGDAALARPAAPLDPGPAREARRRRGARRARARRRRARGWSRATLLVAPRRRPCGCSRRRRSSLAAALVRLRL